MYSPETNARISALRQKAAQRTLTQEELKEAITLLRQGRRSAVEASARKRSAATKQTRSADDLLGELENL